MLFKIILELRYRLLAHIRRIADHAVKPARSHYLADGNCSAKLAFHPCGFSSTTRLWRRANTIVFRNGARSKFTLRWKSRRAGGRALRYKTPIKRVDAVAFIFREQDALVVDIRADQGIAALDVVFQFRQQVLLGREL